MFKHYFGNKQIKSIADSTLKLTEVSAGGINICRNSRKFKNIYLYQSGGCKIQYALRAGCSLMTGRFEHIRRNNKSKNGNFPYRHFKN